MTTTPRPHHARDAALVGLIAFLVHGATSQRGYAWQDSGLFQLRAAVGDFQGESGLALAHPLYLWIGHALTWTPLPTPWSLALLSAAASAGALAVLSLCIADRTEDRAAALAVPAMVGLSHAWWWLSTIAEVYTLSAFFLALEVLALQRWLLRDDKRWLLLLAVANGAHFAVHDFALLSWPVLGIVVLLAWRNGKLAVRDLLSATLLWVLAATPLLVLIAGDLWAGHPPLAVLRSLLTGDGYLDAVLAGPASLASQRKSLVLVALSFVGLLVPLGAWGAVRAGRAPQITLTRALWVWTTLHALFALRYPVPDQFTFLLPTLLLLGLWAGDGLAATRQRVSSYAWWVVVAAGVLVGPIVDASVAPLAARAGVIARERTLPLRDELLYWSRPWKHNEDSAQRFVEAVLEEVPPSGSVLACSTARWPLLAAQATAPELTGPLVLHRDQLAVDPTLLRSPAFAVCATPPESEEPGMTWRVVPGSGVLDSLQR